ncbi:TPA: hypothetical protein ACH3X1_015744 [Trebouxia sp. C0004]
MRPLQPATIAAVCPSSARLLILQVLQGMPVMAAPPRAVETPPVPGPTSPEESAIADLTVLGQAVLLPLQPNKFTVYRLFSEQWPLARSSKA